MLFIGIAETANTEDNDDSNDVSLESQKDMPAHTARGR